MVGNFVEDPRGGARTYFEPTPISPCFDALLMVFMCKQTFLTYPETKQPEEGYRGLAAGSKYSVGQSPINLSIGSCALV